MRAVALLSYAIITAVKLLERFNIKYSLKL